MIFPKMNRNYLNAQEDNMGKILINKKKMKKKIKMIIGNIEMIIVMRKTQEIMSK